MRTFARKWWLEIVVGVIASVALGMGYSLTANRQLAYAPCLAKVMAALHVDPAALQLAKLTSQPIEPQPTDCAISDDVARDADRTIGDLLISDTTLFERLPHLLTAAGMDCQIDKLSIVCDCKSRGPFAIANPCAECQSLVNIPLPLKRALFVAVNKRTAVRNGKTVQLGRYVVEVSYSTAILETPRPPTPSVTAAMGSYEVIDRVYEW